MSIFQQENKNFLFTVVECASDSLVEGRIFVAVLKVATVDYL